MSKSDKKDPLNQPNPNETSTTVTPVIQPRKSFTATILLSQVSESTDGSSTTPKSQPGVKKVWTRPTGSPVNPLGGLFGELKKNVVRSKPTDGKDDYVESSTTAPKGGVEALTKAFKLMLPGEQPEKAIEFGNTMKTCQEKCPMLKEHFDKLKLGEEGGVTVFFSGEAKEAFFMAKDMSGVLKPNTIVLPTRASAVDIMDALIFESCNAEVQPRYEKLDGAFKESAGDDPMSFADYGKQKAAIEADVILKSALTVFALKEAKAPIAYQGQRNLDGITIRILEHRLTDKGLSPPEAKLLRETVEYLQNLLAVDPQEGAVNPPKRNEERDALARKVLAETAEQLNDEKGAGLKAALVEQISTSPHNRKATATDKNKLKTQEMYAYEQMEVAPELLTTIILTKVKQVLGPLGSEPNPPFSEVEAWVKKRLQTLEVSKGEDTKLARQQIILDILKELPRFYRGLRAGPDLSTTLFGFTDEMRSMAGARFNKMVTENYSAWSEVKDTCQLPVPPQLAELELLVDRANKGCYKVALTAGLEVLNVRKSLGKDQSVPLALLQALTKCGSDVTPILKDINTKLDTAPDTATAKELLRGFAAALEQLVKTHQPALQSTPQGVLLEPFTKAGKEALELAK